MTYFTTIDSPIGPLLLTGEDSALTGLYMQHGRKPFSPRSVWQKDPDALADAISQLHEYFAGERREFDLALHPSGNAFELRVWDALRQIPYGETVSYGEIARRIGAPTAARAVGLANGRNPISVIVPCHRVIGADGSLIGYGGGLPRKRYLLDMESGRMSLTAALSA